MSMRVPESVNSKAGKPKPAVRAKNPRRVPEAQDMRPVEQRAKAQIAARAAERQATIAREAYYRAEQRGFAPGHELDDWLAAEAHVDANGPIAVLGVVTDPAGEREAGMDVTPVHDTK